MNKHAHIPDLNAVFDEQQEALWDSDSEVMDETMLHVSLLTRLIESPCGSIMVGRSKRDLVRKHKAKSRAILKNSR